MGVEISTHAPAGGATETGGRNQQPGNQFLLTPLREGRLGLYRWDEKSEVISTHAPAGGATVYRDTYYRDALFLLTPLREGRRL